MSKKHEYGKVPLNKCFNDLYGIRIIFIDNIKYEDIKKFVDDRFNRKLKCYNASKDDYVQHIFILKLITMDSNGNYKYGIRLMKRLI